jgi:uncharacterized OsmC-like protein
MISIVTYKGQLRCESVHIQSSETIISDAPTDNSGKGEAFSPTDAVATSLASCLLTVMGIKAQELKIDLEGSTAKVQKVMASNPRRISEIHVELDMKGEVDQRTKLILERVGMTCPVYQSLHPGMIKKITFNWSE